MAAFRAATASTKGPRYIGRVATSVQIVFDCADPAKLARFWAEALHYKLQDPPQGFDSWEAFLRAQGIPEEDWNSASAVVDPDGIGPRVYFLQETQGETVKNPVPPGPDLRRP